MKKYYKFYGIIAFTLLTFLFAACKKDEKDPYADMKGNYFSVRQFALDEWNTHGGEPFTLLKTVKVNNKLTDSSYTTSDTLNWGNIFKIFFATDISDREFLGQYNFSQFDDNADETHNFYYEAKEEDLYTRKLLITISQYNNKVKGIYIEAEKKTLWNDVVYKLYYKPLQRIQIQCIEKPLTGSKKHTVTEYEFNR